MKKILFGLLATISGVVLLFGYRTSHEAVAASSADLAPAAASGSTTSAGATSSGAADGTGTISSGTTDGTGTSTLADGTYTGGAASTRYGPVQVEVTVSGGAITDVQVLEYPDGNGRDRQINERALPVLVSETLSAQSSDIDMVSGATFTSRGYLDSLQSAIDQAQS
ncbi:FMN-binding protein [Microbacterium sp. SLBN-146]|uniref:FMN-binding protein n=1 Tax=Microbacterium sp. SLBN-146 TaxID=2768457 RepID=UPI00114E16C9|nr:FMN-binding protein [Microbacterium sp. SLBN-146]TQJ30961.1 FMN-binding protein [Microbacterium sp. SLBN-146]